MSKTEELIKILKDNPDHELIFMYPEIGSDYYYTMGHPSSIIVDEYWSDDERVWLRLKDECEIEEHYSDLFADDLFENFPLSDEELKILDEKVEEFVSRQNWKKCICVYIRC